MVDSSERWLLLPMCTRLRQQRGDRGERWNAVENPAVEGDQFMFVAAVNFANADVPKVASEAASLSTRSRGISVPAAA